MTWTDLNANWPQTVHRLQRRFPSVHPSTFQSRPSNEDELAAHLAKTHDLTMFEAREELKDWMFTEGLELKRH